MNLPEKSINYETENPQHVMQNDSSLHRHSQEYHVLTPVHESVTSTRKHCARMNEVEDMYMLWMVRLHRPSSTGEIVV